MNNKRRASQIIKGHSEEEEGRKNSRSLPGEERKVSNSPLSKGKKTKRLNGPKREGKTESIYSISETAKASVTEVTKEQRADDIKKDFDPQSADLKLSIQSSSIYLFQQSHLRGSTIKCLHLEEDESNLINAPGARLSGSEEHLSNVEHGQRRALGLFFSKRGKNGSRHGEEKYRKNKEIGEQRVTSEQSKVFYKTKCSEPISVPSVGAKRGSSEERHVEPAKTKKDVGTENTLEATSESVAGSSRRKERSKRKEEAPPEEEVPSDGPGEIHDVFQLLMCKSHGKITAQNMILALHLLGLNPTAAQIDVLASEMGNCITFESFERIAQALLKWDKPESEKLLEFQKALLKFDEAGRGHLTEDELKWILRADVGMPFEEEDIQEIINEMNPEGTGEFLSHPLLFQLLQEPLKEEKLEEMTDDYNSFYS